MILYRETYPIAYMDMEGVENPNPDSYASPKGLTLKAPSRTGYLFGGWYLDAHYRQKITSVAIGTRGALTLYPKWIEVVPGTEATEPAPSHEHHQKDSHPSHSR